MFTCFDSSKSSGNILKYPGSKYKNISLSSLLAASNFGWMAYPRNWSVPEIFGESRASIFSASRHYLHSFWTPKLLHQYGKTFKSFEKRLRSWGKKWLRTKLGWAVLGTIGLEDLEEMV